MNYADLVRAIFTGTLPILAAALAFLAAVVWNGIEVRGLRTEFHKEVPQIRERLAKIEQRLDDAHIGSAIVHAGD